MSKVCPDTGWEYEEDEPLPLPILPAGKQCETCRGSGLSEPNKRPTPVHIHSFDDSPFAIYHRAVEQIYRETGKHLQQTCEDAVHRYLNQKYGELIEDNERLRRNKESLQEVNGKLWTDLKDCKDSFSNASLYAKKLEAELNQKFRLRLITAIGIAVFSGLIGLGLGVWLF